MIDLTSLRFYVRFKPDHKDKGTLREDGFYCFDDKDDTLELLQLRTDDFNVDVYLSHYEHEEPWSWDFVLPVIKEFFTTVAPKLLKPFCKHVCLSFELGVFSELPHQSKQDDLFIANYEKWIFLQFDYDFETLFSIDDFKRLLNNKHHIHRVYDRDWPQTKVFLDKELTIENFSAAFGRLIKLISMEKEINHAMEIARNNCYSILENSWIEELEGKKEDG